MEYLRKSPTEKPPRKEIEPLQLAASIGVAAALVLFWWDVYPQWHHESISDRLTLAETGGHRNGAASEYATRLQSRVSRNTPRGAFEDRWHALGQRNPTPCHTQQVVYRASRQWFFLLTDHHILPASRRPHTSRTLYSLGSAKIAGRYRSPPARERLPPSPLRKGWWMKAE